VPSTLCHWVNWLYLNRAGGKVGPDLTDFSSSLRRAVQLPEDMRIRTWQGQIHSMCCLQILEALGTGITEGIRNKTRVPFLRFKI